MADYKVRIAAENAFSGAFARLRGELAGIEGAAGKLGRMFGAVGGAVSAGMFANLLVDAVRAGAELNNLAKTTALTVEQLSTIKDVARESGMSLDQISTAVMRFQRALDDARGGAKEASLAFRLLGIDASDGSIKTGSGLDLVATKLLQMEDGVLKNNIAMQLFGRTGAELNEFLADYATRVEKAARISTEMAENNEKLERGWRGLKNSIMDTIEALGQWIAKGAGKLYDVNARDELEQIIDRQKALRTEIERLSDPAKLSVYERIYAPQKLEAARANLTKLNERQIELNKSLGIISYSAADADQNTRKLFQGVVLKADEAAPKVAKVKEETLRLGAALKLLEVPPALKTFTDTTDKTVGAIKQQTAALVRQYETLGMTNLELINYEIRQLESKKAAILLSDDVDKVTKALDDQIDALRRLKDAQGRQDALRGQQAAAKAAADEWQRTADQISQSLTDALLRGFESGKDFAKNFKDTLVNLFKTLVLKPIIQFVLAPVAGGLGGMLPGTASANPLSMFGGGGFNPLSLFGASDFTAALAGDAFMPAALGAGGLGGASTGSMLGSALGGISAAAPWIAAAFGIASLLGAFDRGGPKSGGSASRGVDLESAKLVVGEIGRLFTPDDRDRELKGVVDAIGRGYLDTARLLGISTGGAQFAIGYDADPEGKAGSRVSAQALVNGRAVYNAADIDVGRDEGALHDRLQLEAQRALFAALQTSEMPDYLSKLFDGIEASTATQEQIDEILASATALKAAVDAVSGLGDQFAALDPEQMKAFVDAFGGVQPMMERFAYIADAFYTDGQKIEKATAALTEGFADLGVAVPDTHAAFLELLNSLDLTTQEGREMYEAISALAPLFVAVNGTAQEAADALAALNEAAESIVDTVGGIGGDDRTRQVEEMFAGLMDRIAMLADAAESPADRLALTTRLLGSEISKITARMQELLLGGNGSSWEYAKLEEVLAKLRAELTGTTADLARLTVLTAQYGDEGIASQILALEKWRDEMLKLFTGDATALDAIRKLFDDKLKKIIDGIGEGVTGTIGELERLRQSLRDYVKGLRVRDLSPLSPQAKLAEAQKQYLDLLEKAQGGDVDALRQVQSAADAYLRLARDYYASSGSYNAIFESVIKALEALAPDGPDTVWPQIADAMPTDSPIASQADMREVRDLIAALILETRAGSKQAGERMEHAVAFAGTRK